MPSPVVSEVRALVLTDLVGSTRLVESLGDRAAAEVFGRVDRLTRDLLRDHEGREIDRTDGFLMLFDRPLPAVRFALDLHAALEGLSGEIGRPLEVRAGVHLGEVLLRENTAEDVARGAKALEVEGLAKPTAARVMSLATGGQTLITRGAFDLARRAAIGQPGLDGLQWASHGPYRLKGVAEPMEILEVAGPGTLPHPPPDSDKVQRVRPRRRALLAVPALLLAGLAGVAALAWSWAPAPGPWPVISDDPAIQADFVEAAEAFRDADLRAVGDARRVVEQAPESPLAWLLLSELTSSTEANQALERARKLVEGRDDATATLIRLVDASATERRYGVARDHESELAKRWDHWREANPEHVLGSYLAAVYYPVHGDEPDFHAEEGSFREHLDAVALRAFLEKHPDWAAARVALSQVGRLTPDEAIALFDAGLERCPRCNQLRILRAHSLLEKGELDEARSAFLGALERDRAVPGAREALADIALKKGDEDERLRLQRAILSPETPRADRAGFAVGHALTLMSHSGRIAEGDALLQQAVGLLEEAGRYDDAAEAALGRVMLLSFVGETTRRTEALDAHQKWLGRMEISDTVRSNMATQSLMEAAQLAFDLGDPAGLEAVRDHIERIPEGRANEDKLAFAREATDTYLRALQGDESVLDDGVPEDTCNHLLHKADLQQAVGQDPLPAIRAAASDPEDCGGSTVTLIDANVRLAELTEDAEERTEAAERVHTLWPDADPDGALMTQLREAMSEASTPAR